MNGENPFIKRYGDDVITFTRDMLKVVTEVLEYLDSRYGPYYRPSNMLMFLAVFAALYCIRSDIELEDYIDLTKNVKELLEGLRLLHKP